MKTLKAEEVNGKAFSDGRGLTFFILVGVLFGALFSLVREFTRRLVFGVVLFLITYKALVNAMGHAGLQWDHRLVGSGLLGVLPGLPPASGSCWNSTQVEGRGARRSGIAVIARRGMASASGGPWPSLPRSYTSLM